MQKGNIYQIPLTAGTEEEKITVLENNTIEVSKKKMTEKIFEEEMAKKISKSAETINLQIQSSTEEVGKTALRTIIIRLLKINDKEKNIQSSKRFLLSIKIKSQEQQLSRHRTSGNKDNERNHR